MGEKYDSTTRYRLAQLQRVALRAALRGLMRWRPQAEPEPGYTLLIGCVSALPEVLTANLTMLLRQDRTHLREIIAVFDAPRETVGAGRTSGDVPGVEQALRARFPDLPLRVLYYSPWQAWVLKRIGWGWCYSWLSWCRGIGACRTRYALLHDLDAMLIRPDFLESRYQAIEQRGDQYVGARFYNGNGIVPADGLAVTFELMFDAAWVRRTFKPIQLFNHVGRCQGRRVEFDTFLHAQSLAGRASVLRSEATEMVHPSQLFCQYTDWLHRPRYVPPAGNNLPLLPYFVYLASDAEVLASHRAALDDATASQASLFGKPLDLSGLSSAHVDWLEEQVHRMEETLAGAVRPEVQAYLSSLRGLVSRRDGRPRTAAASASQPAAKLRTTLGAGEVE